MGPPRHRRLHVRRADDGSGRRGSARPRLGDSAPDRRPRRVGRRHGEVHRAGGPGHLADRPPVPRSGPPARRARRPLVDRRAPGHEGRRRGRPQHPEDDLVRHRAPGSGGPEARAAARQDLPDPDAHGEHRAARGRRGRARVPRHLARRPVGGPSGSAPGNARRTRGARLRRAPGQLGTGLRPAEARPQCRRPRPRGRTAVRRRRGRAAVPRDARRRRRAGRGSVAGHPRPRRPAAPGPLRAAPGSAGRTRVADRRAPRLRGVRRPLADRVPAARALRLLQRGREARRRPDALVPPHLRASADGRDQGGKRAAARRTGLCRPSAPPGRRQRLSGGLGADHAGLQREGRGDREVHDDPQ